MTVKRTFANDCSISDRHVLELLPLLDLETNDPLFDGEVSSWRATWRRRNIGPEIGATNASRKDSRRHLPGKPLTAIERSASHIN
jgi:hypothetical protein